MYLYILSFLPCAVKFNGEYIGKASENYAIKKAEKGFFEFIPLTGDFTPASFLWENKQPDDNENVQIIDLYGGFLIIPKFKKQVISDYKELFYKKIDFPDFSASLEVFNENGTKLTVRCGNDKVTESMPFLPVSLDIEKAFLNGRAYLLVFLSDKKTAAFGFELTESRIKTVFRRVCDGYEAKDNLLTITELKNDLLRHRVTTKWDFSNGVTLKEANFRRDRELYSLPSPLLPYAFFEELALGKDPADFLTPRLRPRAAELKEFFGNFRAVLPPPHFKPDDCVLLLYGDHAEYATLTYAGRLIDSVKLTARGE